MSYKTQRTVFLALASISLCLNVFLGTSYYRHQSAHQSSDEDAAEAAEYPLLARRIFLENANDTIINFIPLRLQLYDYIKRNTTTNTIGIFFEYLPTGISIGFNDREQFQYASLGKVPVSMAVLKEVERGHILLNQEIRLEDGMLNNRFGSLWKKGVGASVTVEDAIRFTLRESDNTAKNALASVIPITTIAEVMEQLDIPHNQDQVINDELTVTPKSYSSLFRSLYFSSFLTYDHSQQILDHMAKSIFDDGVAAGIPEEITFSHKVGVLDDLENDANSTFSDCGIVYKPQRPYIICIMERGSEYDIVRRHMQEISEAIYGYIATVN